jgi:hypothetical protein
MYECMILTRTLYNISRNAQRSLSWLKKKNSKYYLNRRIKQKGHNLTLSNGSGSGVGVKVVDPKASPTKS